MPVYDYTMKGDYLRPGIHVVHKWAHPFRRPTQITPKLLKQHGLHVPGILISKEYANPFGQSMVPYWNVQVGTVVSQWREDMISLLS